MYDTHHEVISTEKVPFRYRVAGLGSRFLAWLIDAGCIYVLAYAGLMVLSVLEIMRRGVGLAVGFLWIFALQWLYFMTFEWFWSGQTPGKRMLGIRVIQTEGTSITFFQAAVRNLVRWVDALPMGALPLGMLPLPVACYGVGFVFAVCNASHRRLGDAAAGTLVVHVERRPRLVRSLQEESDKLPMNETQVRQRLGQLTRPQKQVLIDLCLRRDQLRITDRAQLFRAAADYLKAELDLQPAPHQSDEKFVVQLAGVLTASR